MQRLERLCRWRRRGRGRDRGGDGKMKYQKYLTVLQMAIGVTASNRGSLMPLKRKLWVTPSSENPNGATCSVSQGKPSLRRIKGRIHRSKSLDSIDFCEFTGDQQKEEEERMNFPMAYSHHLSSRYANTFSGFFDW